MQTTVKFFDDDVSELQETELPTGHRSTLADLVDPSHTSVKYFREMGATQHGSGIYVLRSCVFDAQVTLS